MTIKPVKHYTPPAYPTLLEAKQDTRLLDALPRRWGKNSSIASLLGTGILIQIAGTARGDAAPQDKDAAIEAVAPLERERQAAADAVRALPATRVAPILEDALANDGRGAFGCVGVAAPAFLSENEALDLIQTELEKAGLNVQDLVTVDGLPIPVISSPVQEWGSIRNSGWSEHREFKVKSLEKGAYTFDLGTADKSVVVAFLNHDDFDVWRKKPSMISTIRSYDYAWLATQVSEAFKQRTDGQPVIIGLFFDPAAYPPSIYDFDVHGLNDDQTRFVENQLPKVDKQALAQETLRRQVLHFVDYLKQEGVVK